MSSKTKIVVLHMKEVIYTAVLLVLGILLILLLFFMFGPKRAKETAGMVSAEPAKYTAGVYTSSIRLQDNTFDVQVTVDSDHINSITLVNLSESAAAMYPLMEPALQNLADQICASQSTRDVTYEKDNKYTSQLLLDAIETALSKAELPRPE